MSEILREAARFLRHADGEPMAVVVLMLNADGTAESVYLGGEDSARQCAAMLPGVAGDAARQLSEEMGFPVGETSLQGGSVSLPPSETGTKGRRSIPASAAQMAAERITAKVIGKAKG